MTDQNTFPQGLKLEACTVSVDGGKTEQTLADLANNVNQANATLGNLNQTVAQVNTDMTDLKKTYDKNDFFLKSNAFKPLETVRLSKNGGLVYGPAANGICSVSGGQTLDNTGNLVPDPNCNQIDYYHVLNSSIGFQVCDFILWHDDQYNLPSCAFRWFGAIHPNDDGAVDLGSATHAWNNCYLKNAPQITSDVTEKNTVVKANDASNKKLLQALYGLTASTYKLNQATEKKGDDKARIHSGYIAQEVEQALKDQGLDPSAFALWTSNVKRVNKDADTGQKDSLGNPVLIKKTEEVKDDQGNPVYQQKLRYSEIFALMLEAHKQEIESLKQEVNALKTAAKG